MSNNESLTGLEIAVIGMAGRFPGARNIDEYWDNLKNGRECVAFFNDEELAAAGNPPGLLQNPNYVKAHGILEGIEYFDASFFGYIPVEADIMDPQMRVFHECAWQALEDAGYTPGSYKGLIGVYGGATHNFDWEALVLVSGKSKNIGWFAAENLVEKDFLCTRISYKLNLKGPSFTMYTGCSTSLVAIHLACQGILNGECDMALAGGVTITRTDKRGYLFQDGMIYSADGHCRAFDAVSSGIVGGDAVCIVALKRLEAARADGDFIYAVVKGSAINNDGIDKVGFSAPGVDGQAQVIRMAQQMAEVAPESIAYVETHGTATVLGDSVEIEALKLAFNTNKRGFCGLGSVKSSIGHVDSASGAAGFIKTVLILRWRMIPASLHFENPNPRLELADSPFYINTGLKPWPEDSYPMRAAVSSFGIGGTNAHVILEEYRDVLPTKTAAGFQGAEKIAEESVQGGYHLLLLSGKSSTALDRNTENLAAYLKNHPDIELADAAYTLQSGRAHFDHRRMVVCEDVARAVEALSVPQHGQEQTNIIKGDKRPVVFMFSGQGSQYVNMGLELYREEPLFRQEIDACFGVLNSIMGEDIKEILFPQPGKEKEAEEKIDDAVYTGPIKFAFEYAAAKLLMSWGIRPRVMIGHSFGELVVACLSGVLPLEGALELVVLRGKLMMKMPPGAMMGVPLGAAEIAPMLNEDLSLAAVNTPSLCIVSGTVEAVNKLEQDLKQKGHECLLVNFPRASHSKMMQPIVEEFVEKASRIKLGKPQIPYISGLSGTWITMQEAVDPAYWGRHLVGTVQFSAGVQELLKENYMFVQVGCDKGLPLFVGHHLGDQGENRTLNIVRHRKEKISDMNYISNQLGRLWLNGVEIDWSAYHSRRKRKRIPLPTYSFDRVEYMTKGDPYRLVLEAMAGAKGTTVTEMSDMFYVPSWTRARLPLKNKEELAAAEPFLWLIFLDEYGLGARLAERLTGAGRRIITVGAGRQFARISDHEFTINPAQEKDYVSLLDELAGHEKSLRRVVHLWGVQPETGGERDLSQAEKALERGLYSLVYLVKTFGRKGFDQEMQIEVVTNNMQDVGGEAYLCPEKSTVLGAVRVLPLEFSNIGCRSVDVTLPERGSQQEERLVEQLIVEFSQDVFVDVVAYRGAERWVQTLNRLRLPERKQEALPLKERGVYLVIGGLGGIGLELASYLAEKVKARLVLTGRSLFPARKEWQKWLQTHDENDSNSIRIRRLEEMEKRGAQVLTLRADVTVGEQVQQVISRTRSRFGPIAGVVYSAGIPGGGSIQLKTRQMLEEALVGKVKGPLVLADALGDAPLDFFIFCSSGNAFLPMFGQVDYCAANTFLDAFANYRNIRLGKPACSIGWNRWINTGMAVAVEKKHEKNTGQKLSGGITPEQGKKIFNRLLQEPIPQVMVDDIDVIREFELRKRRIKKVAAKQPPTEQTPREEKEDKQKLAAPASRPRPELTTPYAAPQDEPEQKLAKIFQDFFSIEKVGIDDDFFELGGDSLKALAIINHIKQALNPSITLSDFLLHPKIRELAAVAAATASRPGSINDKLESIVKLSEQQHEKNIFIIHPVHGMIFQYRELGKLLGKKYAVFAVQARSRAARLPDTMAKLEEDYIEQIRAVQPEGPYIIAGYCFGNMIAYNMIRRLEEKNIPIERFIMLDELTFLPFHVIKYYREERIRKMLLKPFERLGGLFKKKAEAELAAGGKRDDTAGSGEKDAAAGAAYVEMDEESLRARATMNIQKLNMKYWQESPYRRISGLIKAPVFAVKAEKTHLPVIIKDLGKLTLGKFTYAETPGDHDTIFEYPYVQELAELIIKNLSTTPGK